MMHGSHFLSVALKGKDLNSHAIGARVTLFYNGQKQVNEYFPTRGFMSASSGDLHFGLGPVKSIDSLIIRWPDLSEQVLKNVTADQRIILNAENAVRPLRRENDEPDNRLVTGRILPGLDFRHIEDPFENFKYEVLVPHTLFAEGPALAVADFNGDGLEDIFAGGAKDQLSVIYMQQNDGTFKPKTSPVFIKDLFCENVDATAFDADGDRDNDLYLVRGGSEVSLGNPLLGDRLMINDGNGEFSESDKGSLPLTNYNGSCVAPCDYDNDGDQDLFVGTRSVPGAYGLSPKQLLLENDGHGNFSDVTERRMKRLTKIGMVTDACWTDYDSDGDNDLILVGEWMKVSVLNNDDGSFTDRTRQAGLQETSGWWNCIHACDIDNDGDIDLIGGNHGLNSILRASPEKPVEMYVNDFDSNGTLDQVICQYQDEVSYPVASLDELSKQIPGIEKKFPNYSDFGGKTLMEIFARRTVNGSVKKNTVLFASCLFLNNGDGTFKINKLPVEAQISPVRDIMTGDFNSDGKTDIALVGNDYTAKPSYGRHDASYGWLLLNDAEKKYRALMPTTSGFIVEGDARKILPLKVSGKKYILVAVNDNDLQVFEQPEN